jgi:hypothetical protein
MAGEINKRIQQLTSDLESKKLAAEAFRFFKGITPIRSGNARANTDLRGDTIEAQYPYAGVLDKGRHMTSSGMRGSTQAPNGMSRPTENHIQLWISKHSKG